MSRFPMFTTEYRGEEFAIDFNEHQNGVTICIQVADLPWRPSHDAVYAGHEEAKAAGIAQARAIIDKMLG